MRSEWSIPTRCVAEKYPRLVAEVEECLAEGERLTKLVRKQLASLNSGDDNA